MNERVPCVVDLNYYHEQPIDGADGMKLLFYKDGRVGFHHLCDRGTGGVITCAPALSPDHALVPTFEHPYPILPHGRDVPTAITVTPSILCPDCGTHGFITESRWVA